jgi:hypothetical protein
LEALGRRLSVVRSVTRTVDLGMESAQIKRARRVGRSHVAARA